MSNAQKIRSGSASAAHLFTAILLSLCLFGCGSGGGGESGQSSPAGPATATLAWDAVAAPSLSGYRIYYGTSPGSYLQSFGDGVTADNVTSYVVAGLSSGTRYYFAITAYDTSNNESAFSNEVFKDIP